MSKSIVIPLVLICALGFLAGCSGDEGSKPHAVTAVDNTRHRIPTSQLQTQYNGFGKVSQIRDYGENNYKMLFDYGPDDERWRTRFYRNTSTLQRTTYYMGDYEEIVEGGTTRRLYYLGGNVLYKKQTSCPDSIFYLFTDHLGSVIAIVDQSGSKKFEATYDAWGNQTVTRNDIGFHRGYTGHEMLPEFGLINMNGRLYDPAIGRFLSTDNYVQEPWNSQNFNRYSYCLNNPLKYSDPSGEIFGIDDLITIAAFAYIGGIMANVSHCSNFNANPFNPVNWNWSSVGTYLGLAGGALNGLGISTNVPGIFTNGLLHATGNVAINGITNISEHRGFFYNWGMSATVGFLEGTIGGYIESKRTGLNYWWGNKVKYNRTQWSFINTDKPDYTIVLMRTNTIAKNENDCMIATMTEIENETGGGRTYDDFFTQVENNYTEEGVRMTVGEYKRLLLENFNATELSRQSHNLFDPSYMEEVASSGDVITVHFKKPAHADNVRKLKVFLRDKYKNTLVFRQRQYNANALEFNYKNEPTFILRIKK